MVLPEKCVLRVIYAYLCVINKIHFYADPGILHSV